MESKSLIYLGVIVGSTIGGFIPMLWGASMFSMSSVITTALGGIAGIYAGFRIANW